MSCLENEKIYEAAWEKFQKLYEKDIPFTAYLCSLFNENDWNAFKNDCPIKAQFEALGRIFEHEWNKDCEGFYYAIQDHTQNLIKYMEQK